MARKTKYYSVYRGKGRVPSIVSSWANCKEKVNAYPGAEYKSFNSAEEAFRWLQEKDGTDRETFLGKYPWMSDFAPEQSSSLEGPETGASENNRVRAYVDGSFTPDVQAYGYGVVLVQQGRELARFSGYGNQPEAVKLRNVAGEMLGAIEAVKKARQYGFKEITIIVDYQGLESWAKGTWKRNNKHTRAYHQFMHRAMQTMDIRFEKVQAHSGNCWNELADKMAREGIKEFLNER